MDISPSDVTDDKIALVLELHHQLFLSVPGWAAGCLSVLKCWQVLLLHYVSDSLCDKSLSQWHTAAANVPVAQVSGALHVHMLTECCCPWVVWHNWISTYCKQHTASIYVRSFSGQLMKAVKDSDVILFFMYSILAGKWLQHPGVVWSTESYPTFFFFFFYLCERKQKALFLLVGCK